MVERRTLVRAKAPGGFKTGTQKVSFGVRIYFAKCRKRVGWPQIRALRFYTVSPYSAARSAALAVSGCRSLPDFNSGNGGNNGGNAHDRFHVEGVAPGDLSA